MSELHVVLGASGSIGNAIIRELASHGKRVRGVNRSGKALVPNTVEMISGDASKLDDMRRALEGASAVYNATHPAKQDAVLEVASELGVKYVLVNNLYMYDPSQGPMSEKSPVVYTNREGGRFYDNLTKEALAAHGSGKLRVVVGRASDIYGKHVRHGYNRELIYAPAFAGGAASIVGAADVPHSFAYADDVAKAFVNLGTSDDVDGQIWHLPTMEPVTQANLLAMIYSHIDTQLKYRAANGFILTMLGLFNADMRKLKREKLYQFTTPWLVDSSKYERTFGRHVTEIEDAIKETVKWFRANSDWP